MLQQQATALFGVRSYVVSNSSYPQRIHRGYLLLLVHPQARKHFREHFSAGHKRVAVAVVLLLAKQAGHHVLLLLFSCRTDVECRAETAPGDAVKLPVTVVLLPPLGSDPSRGFVVVYPRVHVVDGVMAQFTRRISPSSASGSQPLPVYSEHSAGGGASASEARPEGGPGPRSPKPSGKPSALALVSAELENGDGRKRPSSKKERWEGKETGKGGISFLEKPASIIVLFTFSFLDELRKQNK